MKYALDTNIVVAALNGVEPVVRRLAMIDVGDVIISDVVIAELLFGARTSARVEANVAKVERLIERFAAAPFETGAARRFAEVKASLRKRGIAKQDIDLAIACIALERRATLVSHDAALLAGDIDGLSTEDWL